MSPYFCSLPAFALKLKLSKGVGLLAKIRHFVPRSVLRSLYFSFINPHVDYNILNWGMASLTNLDPIDKKIKKAVRIISFKDSDHPSAPLYKNLKILPLSNSFELRQAKHMWKLINGFPFDLVNGSSHIEYDGATTWISFST